MKHIVFIFLVVLIFSCTNKKSDDSIRVDELPLPSENSDGYFSSHFMLERIVPIETTDDFLISGLNKVIDLGDRLLLFSAQEGIVALADASSGKIQMVVRRKGNGPGESNRVLDVAFDELSGKIFIYNDYGKSLTFSTKGEYLSEMPVEGFYENVFCKDGKVFFHSLLDGYGCLPYRLGVYDLSSKQWSEIGSDKKVEFPIRSWGRLLAASKQVWITAPLDGCLYRLEEGGLQPVYRVDIPDLAFADDYAEEAKSNPARFIQRVSKEKIIHGINSVRETTRYLVFRTNRNDFLFLEKKTGKLFKDNFLWEKLGRLSPREYYPHDGDDDCLMFILPAMNFDAQTFASVCPEGWKDKLKQLNVDEDGNPILLFFKEKPLTD